MSELKKLVEKWRNQTATLSGAGTICADELSAWLPVHDERIRKEAEAKAILEGLVAAAKICDAQGDSLKETYNRPSKLKNEGSDTILKQQFASAYCCGFLIRQRIAALEKEVAK